MNRGQGQLRGCVTGGWPFLAGSVFKLATSPVNLSGFSPIAHNNRHYPMPLEPDTPNESVQSTVGLVAFALKPDGTAMRVAACCRGETFSYMMTLLYIGTKRALTLSLASQDQLT